MDTIPVNICYRPLRVGWAIRSDDISAFRSAVRLSYALWGGCFNPILIVDREEEVKHLVDLFGVDVIWPIGDTDEVRTFPGRFPYLITPFLPNAPLVGGSEGRNYAQLLDVHNAFVHMRDRPEWQAVKNRGVRLYTWQPEDPLANVFLVQFGSYPSAEDAGTDYRAMLVQAAEAAEHTLDSSAVIPADVLDHPNIACVSRHGIKRHYSVDVNFDNPGFFVGDASDVNDLVCHWNLRAANIRLWFIDINHFARYGEIIPAWYKMMREIVSHRSERKRNIALWCCRQNIDEAAKPFGDMHLIRCSVDEAMLNGHNVRAPMIHLGEVSMLGVVGSEGGKRRISFALSEKPFCSDVWFHQQRLVASISVGSGLYEDEQHTLAPPYLPELNEFYARTMHFHYNKLRIEPGRVGLVIKATEHNTFLNALPVADMMEHLFGMAGYSVKLSDSGLTARQLISQLGGVNGAKVFKIPGVRRLLRTYGPTATFKKASALQLIGKKDHENPNAKFNDHQDLYIEPRPIGTKLDPRAVFAYLVEKGLFRIGAKLDCPSCRMASWTALDELKQRVVCELCGHEHDATRQLVKGEWHYRRSGVLGAEKNAKGAIPVALTLQQLEANLSMGFEKGMYSPSLSFEPREGVDLPECELDFVWVIPRPYPQKTAVILGECKDRGPIKLDEFEKDVKNLRSVADSLPSKRFKTFVLLSKLAPFTSDEIERAKALNDKYRHRAILLTDRELEPYFMYERTKTEFQIDESVGTPEDLAQITLEIYFKEQLPKE